MKNTICGLHLVVELKGCPFSILNDEQLIRQAIEQASQQSMSTLLNLVSYKFHPIGVTALGLLAESHISIHTWPEIGYAAVDIFTCGECSNPYKACDFLAKFLKADKVEVTTLPRGSNVNKGNFHQLTKDYEQCQVAN
ncbi:MAG: adenosylmethionine decarboxylase [Desulfonauticus sp.]|nr:adenosylmethionine decarboxylase [Desulfonauticus sp.]